MAAGLPGAKSWKDFEAHYAELAALIIEPYLKLLFDYSLWAEEPVYLW